MTAWKKALVVTICASAWLAGCASRSVIVPAGEPVRIRETLRSVKVWVADARGDEVEAVVDIPAGWYALPDTGPGK